MNELEQRILKARKTLYNAQLVVNNEDMAVRNDTGDVVGTVDKLEVAKMAIQWALKQLDGGD